MSFSASIAKFGAVTAGRIEHIRRGVAIKLFSAVILDTPVDTGRLRANWMCTEGQPEDSTTSNTDKSGSGTIQKVNDTVSASKNGDTDLYLTNSLPYAQVAEFGEWHGPTDKVTSEGFSRKSPSGMVRKNVVRFNRLIKIAIQEAKDSVK